MPKRGYMTTRKGVIIIAPPTPRREPKEPPKKQIVTRNITAGRDGKTIGPYARMFTLLPIAFAIFTAFLPRSTTEGWVNFLMLLTNSLNPTLPEN